MPKVAQSVLDEFGKAVKRARSLKGWQLDQLSAAMEGANASRSYLSNLEKGKRQISPPTVGRLIKALGLDESWIDKFLDDDVSPEAEETPVDRETERLLRLKAKDDKTPDAAEDLLILLANTHAEGQYADTMTAYQALKSALEANARLRERGETGSNADDQLARVMAEVTALNAQGRVDEANSLLDSEEKRMIAAHRAEKERLDAQATALLERRLDQDRVRNDPAAAAKRLIRDLHRQAPPGGVWQATRVLLINWREDGKRDGDPFALRVALALARTNNDKVKGPAKGFAVSDLGNCHLALGDRASDDRHPRAAEKAYRAALKLFSKQKDPHNWAVCQIGLGNALSGLGERTQDDALLREAIAAHQAALSVRTKEDIPTDWATSQNNLGTALAKLGERTQDDALLRDGVAAFEAALSVWSKKDTPMDWAQSKHNIAICYRRLARLHADPVFFGKAEAAYRDALEVWTPETAEYHWADAVGGLGELELERFEMDGEPVHLDAAEGHIRTAQGVMDTASEYLAERCDDLLAKIAAARGSL